MKTRILKTLATFMTFSLGLHLLTLPVLAETNDPTTTHQGDSSVNLNFFPSVTNAKAEQSSYNPNTTVKLSYDYKSLSQSLTVEAKIYRVVYVLSFPVKTEVKNWPSTTIPANSSGTKNLTWDQKDMANGYYAGDGSYLFEVTGKYGSNSTLTPSSFSFTLVTPSISKPTLSTATYTPTSDPPLVVTGTLSNLVSGETADVTYMLLRDPELGPNVNPELIYIKQFTDLTNGSHAFTWDGTGATPGVYHFVYTGTTSHGVTFTEKDSVSDPFNVMATAVNNGTNPFVNSLFINPNPYDPTQTDAVLSYVVNNWTSSTRIDVTIYDLENNVIASWQDLTPTNGGNTLTWNGSNNLANGFYILEVKGDDGNYVIPAQKAVFTVEKAGSIPPGTPGCIVFSDAPPIAADHPDCVAIQYFKDHGVFTGTAEGKLDPYGLLQRDQVTKVLLMASNNYNGGVNYCTNVTQLKDMGPHQWSQNYVCRGMTLYLNGKPMITGYTAGPYAGYFKPELHVNRAEFSALVFRLFGNAGNSNYSDIQSGIWYEDYAKSAKFYDFFSGNNFHPEKTLTRLEVIQALWKLHLATGKL